MGTESPLILYTLGGDSNELLLITPPPIIMNFPYLNNSQVEELTEFGVIELTDELMAIINQWGADDDSESNLVEMHT